MSDIRSRILASCSDPLYQQAQRLALQSLSDACVQHPGAQALAEIIAPNQPLALRIPDEERLFLATYFLEQSALHAEYTAEYLRNPPKEPAQALDLTPLEQVFAQTQGSCVDERSFGKSSLQLKPALTMVLYSLLRSGILPEACDDLTSAALVSGVCTCIDVQAVAASIRPQQQAFHFSRLLVNASCHAGSRLTDMPTLTRALELSAALTPLCLEEMRQHPALLTQLNVRLMPLEHVQSGLLLFCKPAETAVAPAVQTEEKVKPSLPVQPKLPLK